MFLIRLLSEKTNAIVFWQSEGARYIRAMCLFLIPDIPTIGLHIDIPNMHISTLGDSLSRICGQPFMNE